MTAKATHKGIIRPDINQSIQTALPNFKFVTGGYVEFYNLCFNKDKIQHHQDYIFQTPEKAQQCADLLKSFYNRDYHVIRSILLVDDCLEHFKRCATRSERKLLQYKAFSKRLKSLNYDSNFYSYYSVCFDLAQYKKFTYLTFRTEQQAKQAIELLAQLGQPTPFYLLRHQAPLFFNDRGYRTQTKKNFLKRIKNIAYSEQQLTSLIALAGAQQTISYQEINYYTLQTSDPTINNTLYVLQEREQAEILADILNSLTTTENYSQTTTENYGLNFSIATAKAFINKDMQPAFNDCLRLSIKKLIHLIEKGG